jgi:hypothetical protein
MAVALAYPVLEKRADQAPRWLRVTLAGSDGKRVERVARVAHDIGRLFAVTSDSATASPAEAFVGWLCSMVTDRQHDDSLADLRFCRVKGRPSESRRDSLACGGAIRSVLLRQ